MVKMNEISIGRGLATSGTVTIVIGMIVFRLLPGWDALTGEVSSSDAWMATFFYHLFYALFVTIGTLIFLLELRLLKGRPRRYTIAVAAAATIATLHLALNVYGLEVRSGIMLALGLVAGSWAYNMAIFYITQLFHRNEASGGN